MITNNNSFPSDTVIDLRSQCVARLATLTAEMNADPTDTAPVVEAFQRVLLIAESGPAGWSSLLDGLKACSSNQEVLAFCRAFVHIMSFEGDGDPQYNGLAAHDEAFPQ